MRSVIGQNDDNTVRLFIHILSPPILPGIFLPLNTLPGAFDSLNNSISKRNLSLSCGTRCSVSKRISVCCISSSESPALHHSLESFSFSTQNYTSCCTYYEIPCTSTFCPG